MLSNNTHLVIPDSHCKPGVSNERYVWLGKFIRDLKPDVVVNLGDHADMPSLCSYDVGKKSFEGRRYKQDVEHVRNSLALIKHHAGGAYSNARRVLTLGNHEQRIEKAIDSDPAKLEGIISTKDLGYEEAGWEVHPYGSPVIIDGICYCHYMPSGVMGRPIGGENAASMLLKKQFQSCTVGHSHLFDFSCRTKPDGTKIIGLVAGCYFTHNEQYAGPCNKLYSRGVVVKRNVKNGSYDHEWISIQELKRRYDS